CRPQARVWRMMTANASRLLNPPRFFALAAFSCAAGDMTAATLAHTNLINAALLEHSGPAARRADNSFIRVDPSVEFLSTQVMGKSLISGEGRLRVESPNERV